MQLTPADNLACPLDGAPLQRSGHPFVCAHGHSFDPARQGYLHLLPVQQKRSREPGDSKAMVEARTRFLDAGLYAPISQQLNALALQHLPAGGDLCVVDAGCGEGYYLQRLGAALEEAAGAGNARLIGFDIAKPAVLAAARRSRAITWLVASNRNPPLLPGTVDLILSMFGFPDYAAFAQRLKPGGRVMLVEAGPEHLIELREVIYPQVKRSPAPSLEGATAQGFELIETQPLQYRTEALNREQIADLLTMTPHLYRATAEGKAAAAQLPSLRLTVDVLFRVLAYAPAQAGGGTIHAS